MSNFYSTDLEIILSIIIISLLINILYDILKNHGKLHLNLFKTKINIVNKNNWSENKYNITKDTKYLEFDFIFQICNNKNTNNNIYNLDVYKRKKLKYLLLENHYLNLTDTMKSVTGATSYEKLKYVNLLPYEIKEYRLKIKITKEEFENMKKEPIYIRYKNRNINKKLKLNKFIKNSKVKNNLNQ